MSFVQPRPTLAAVAGMKEMMSTRHDGAPSLSIGRTDQTKASAASTTDEAIISDYPVSSCRLEFSMADATPLLSFRPDAADRRI